MNVIYKAGIRETIQNEILRAKLAGREISKIELTTVEMDKLLNEIGSKTDRTSYCPRTVPFKGFDVVEVFNAE